MNPYHDPKSPGNSNIISNLRGRYAHNEAIKRASDIQLLKAYNEFSQTEDAGQDGEDEFFCDFLNDFLSNEPQV